MSEPRQERCDNCRFWAEKFKQREGADSYFLGKCHRLPPVVSSEGPETASKIEELQIWMKSIWPITYESDWCGEWQPKTTRKDLKREKS